jgi:hypothetical protein
MMDGQQVDKQQIDMEDLERLAFAMAQAIPELDCPECCDCGVVYQYVERSAEWYREEWEWACFAVALIRCQENRKQQGYRLR